MYLLEELENGAHPLDLSAVYDSLASVYTSQVLVTTYSRTFLRRANPEDVLCFATDGEGATAVIQGHDHPHLQNRRGAVDMNLLFAVGAIGRGT